MKRVYLDKSLETRITEVSQRREDGTVNKTVKDLLRERLLALDDDGDPFAVKAVQPRKGTRKPTAQPA